MFLSNLVWVPILHYPDSSNGRAILEVHSLEDEQPDSVLHSDQDESEIDAVEAEKIRSNINPNDSRNVAKAIYDKLMEK